MMYLGIVGAETPLAKIVLEQIKQHKEEYRVCFMADASYKESKAEATYTDADSALLMVSATLVLDFSNNEEEAYQNAKFYAEYHVPAILTTPLSEDKIELLEAYRKVRYSVPALLIEPNLSFNRAMLIEQAALVLKTLGRDVEQVVVNCKYPADKAFDIEPYMPLIKRLHQALGVTEWKSGPVCHNSRRYEQQIGFVQMRLEKYFAGQDTLQITIKFHGSCVELHESSGADDIWRGIETLMNYVADGASTGEVMTTVLPKLVKRYW